MSELDNRYAGDEQYLVYIEDLDDVFEFDPSYIEPFTEDEPFTETLSYLERLKAWFRANVYDGA